MVAGSGLQGKDGDLYVDRPLPDGENGDVPIGPTPRTGWRNAPETGENQQQLYTESAVDEPLIVGRQKYPADQKTPFMVLPPYPVSST